ncbi:Chaperone protein DnaK [Labilithrix luteola]|uniref:Chaperone protein DnaK n=1 Tax=Labilithrix luteola TaxID=1391654 RepID=A0A0K1PTL8_9BACT|nr:molecular chaperone DnaK [Labilithrix luteola]AKU96479.1 Chaperone protein DnaK [Labilithrix luteola]
MSKVIGIDLGTTNSCVAIVEQSPTGKVDVKIIPNSEGARTTPSIVGFTASGERLVGQPAKRQAVTNAQNTVYAVKRLIGRKYQSDEVKHLHARSPYKVIEAPNGDAWVSVAGKDMSPPEVSAMVLGRMKEIAESYLGETITDAVVTVPAYFDDAQRQATRDAGKIAGLNVRRIINEPTAAAIAYGLEKKNAERIAVYDLGGGTFDVSILEIQDGVFSVKATNGDTYLGGEDFDLRIVDAIVESFQGEHKVDLKKDRMALQRLKEAAEKAKHELSSSLETEINLPFIASNSKGEPLHVQKTMKRAELELLTADLVERSLEPCRKCLVDAKLSAADIQSVVLVGGMTRMPAVQKAVKEFFGRDPNKGVNPDEVVAAGAALQGAALEGESPVEMLLLDVTPLSLGVETGGGVFTVLIPRNTTIPTERSEVFTTSVDNQNFVPLHILQGERPMAADNASLGRFELTGIPPAPRGVPKIQVTFRIDANGVVSVDAKDIGTGRSQQMNVQPTSGLSKDQIERIIAEGERHQVADIVRKELAELRNQAETLLYTTEAAIEGYQDLVDGEMIDRTRESCQRLRGLLDDQGDLSNIRSSYQELETLTFKIAESLYGTA